MGDPFTQLWADFWAWVDLHPSGDWYFRGQAGIFPIIPKIGRPSYAPEWTGRFQKGAKERFFLGRRATT